MHFFALLDLIRPIKSNVLFSAVIGSHWDGKEKKKQAMILPYCFLPVYDILSQWFLSILDWNPHLRITFCPGLPGSDVMARCNIKGHHSDAKTSPCLFRHWDILPRRYGVLGRLQDGSIHCQIKKWQQFCDPQFSVTPTLRTDLRSTAFEHGGLVYL